MKPKSKTTQDRILDTAERLFGEHGFEAVGMRTLAEEAEVNLGAATYHFGSKENLYRETFLRRFQPTLERRLPMLEVALEESDGAPLRVEQVMEAMLRPPFETSRKYPTFARLMSRNILAPPPFIADLMIEMMAPQMMRFMAEISRAAPEIPPALIQNRMRMSAGALLFSTGDLFQKQPQIIDLSDEELLAELIRFATHGILQGTGED